MSSLAIEIDSGLQKDFGGLRVLWFVAEGLKAAAYDHSTSGLVAKVQSELGGSGLTPEQIGQLPLVVPWRSAFTKQGVKPSQFRSSAEALLRRFAAGKYNPVGIPVVDIYNALSARHQVPMGAYDASKLPGQRVSLRYGGAGDTFEPLGGKAADYVISENIAVYAVGGQVICWCFNHRDSRNTSVDHDTDTALFVLEAIDRHQYAAQERAVGELRDVLSAAGARLSDLRTANALVASL
jgi:DNA/RNA-binding domain of Phe-tRNA-synthetase-like protein